MIKEVLWHHWASNLGIPFASNVDKVRMIIKNEENTMIAVYYSGGERPITEKEFKMIVKGDL